MTKIVVYLEPHLSQHSLVKTLVQDFKSYKGFGANIKGLGRDAEYTWPKECRDEQLFHLHLIDLTSPKYRKHDQYYRTSDVHLVYCAHPTLLNTYLFIDILEPDAHDQARMLGTMIYLARAAKKFRDSHL